jgi:hypothetical protein
VYNCPIGNGVAQPDKNKTANNNAATFLPILLLFTFVELFPYSEYFLAQRYDLLAQFGKPAVEPLIGIDNGLVRRDYAFGVLVLVEAVMFNSNKRSAMPPRRKAMTVSIILDISWKRFSVVIYDHVALYRRCTAIARLYMGRGTIIVSLFRVL